MRTSKVRRGEASSKPYVQGRRKIWGIEQTSIPCVYDVESPLWILMRGYIYKYDAKF